ncbi:SpoIID/LytB domain-containing protein [Nakamurella silvestris]|nr:SpoIID/LytB domain-containing protein [Nakamurella silvestris]
MTRTSRSPGIRGTLRATFGLLLAVALVTGGPVVGTATAAGAPPADPGTSADGGPAPDQLAGEGVRTMRTSVVPSGEAALNRPTGGYFEISGQGSGHGRGMSQYGAKGGATAGRTAEEMLDFYYPKTTRTVVPASTTLRVWISYGQGAAGSPRQGVEDGPEVEVATGLVVTNVATGKAFTVPAAATVVRTLSAGTGFNVQAKVNGAWKALGTTTGDVRFTGVTPQTLVFGSETRSYRGSISAVRVGSGAMTVNTVALEDYLKSVVPREMPSYWPAEALRTQAVAARTYAMANLSPSRTWDICDTTYCQVYGGTSYAGGEVAATNAAIASTKGEIRTYSGYPINAQFGASSGGYTVDGGVEYLQARNDPWDRAGIAGSGAVWTTRLSVKTIESAYPSIGAFRSMTVQSRDGRGAFGGRVLDVLLTGSAGSVVVTGNNIRQIGGFESNLFSVKNPDAGRKPVGHLDSMTRTANGVTIRGWALDADAPLDTVSLLVSVKWSDRTSNYKFKANSTRTDVGRAYPAYGDQHGFVSPVPFSHSGPATVCVTALDLGPAAGNTALGCQTFTVAKPIGKLDSAKAVDRTVTVRGWALLQDVKTVPLNVVVEYSGAASGVVKGVASHTREDIGRVYPGAGVHHGVIIAAPVPVPGKYTFCLITNQVSVGTARINLGCQAVVVG